MRKGAGGFLLAAALGLAACGGEDGPDGVVEIKLLVTSDAGRVMGTISWRDTDEGIVFAPDLRGVPRGQHGFHIHAFPDCGDAGRAAGGHYDPEETGRHEGPEGDGHLGDLPALFSDEGGRVTQAVTAPRLAGVDIRGLSLVIHLGGDNYSDTPRPLGGGGARLACGVIE